MRKKFLLVLTLLILALGGGGKLFAQELLVNCDYNSSTEGYGKTKFSNYAGAMYVPVSDFAALKAAVEAGTNVQLTADITTTSAIKTEGITSVIDLNGKTLTIGAGDNKFNDESNVTIKKGNVNITGVTVKGNAIFCLDEYEKTLVSTLTFDNVNLTGDGYSSAYGIFYIGESSVLNVNGGEWNLNNDTHASGGVFKADGSGAKLNIDGLNLTAHNVRRVVTYANTTIENSTMAISGDADGVDAEMEHGFNRSPLAISNSTITMKDMVGRGITAQNGAVIISENSNVNITNCQEATIDVRNNQTVTIENSTVFVDKKPTIANGCKINGDVILPPMGNDFNGYTRTDAIWGEVWGNARESFVINVLDAEGIVMGTTSLNNIGGIINGNVNVTWSLKFDAASNTDEYWTMSWTKTPTINNMPAKVELLVDGVKVSGGPVVLNGPDNINAVDAAIIDENGVIKSYTTFAKAKTGDNIAIVKAGTYTVPSGKNLTITGAVEGVVFANIGAHNMGGANVTFNNVTFNYANVNYRGLQHAGDLAYNNCTFNGQLFLYGESETFNKCTFNQNSSDAYNVWTYSAKEVEFNECTFNSAGKSVLIYAESESIFNKVTVTDCEFNASQVVEGKAAIEMDSSLTGGINLTIDENTTATGFANGNVSGNSLWNNKKGNADAANNDITVTVDNTVVLKPIILALEGEGTAENPYLINNLEELVWFRDNVDKTSQDGSTQYAGKYIKLTADIDLAGINWNPIGSMSSDHGSFKGVFDGDNHIIKNLNCEQAGNGLGLFARTAGNAEIKNLKLNNVTVKSTDNSNYVGGVVGNAYASTKINNVHVSGTINIAGRGYIGGIAGHGYVVMDNVSVVANEGSRSLITSTFWCAGGILGYAGEGSTNIMNANVEGITITSAAGGLGAIVGMAEDNEGTQPISGSNLSAKNVEIKTYVGAYGTYYEDYAIGYLYGGNPTSKLTGKLNVENVTLTNASGKTPAEVSDAVANVDGKIYFAFSNNEFKLLENGNNVTILRAGKYSIPTGKDLTITGAVNGVVFENIGAYGMGGANVTFNNVTFNYADNSTYKGLQHSGNLVYNNCTINGQVFLYGESETFNGCTFNTKDSNNYNVWTYGAKNVAFNECTFNSAGKSVLIYAESAEIFNNVTVAKCTFNASQAVEGKAAIEMDSSLTGGINLTIDAETTATGFGTGNVSGNSLWNNKKGNADAKNNDITVKVGGVVVLAPIYEAQIGETKYRKLADAFTAAKAGDVVTVFEGTYAMPSMKAGITIEGQGDVLFEGTLKGTLENLTMKNIHIKGANAQRWAYAKGDLVFENVTFEATSVYALHFDGIAEGTNLTYKDCTIIGWAAMGGSPASCTFDGCTIKGNGTYGVIRTYFDATIKDCTFDVANVNTNDIYEDGIHAVSGAEVTVTECTNANGDMKDLVNVHANSVVTVDGVVIKNVVKANDNYYRTLAEAIDAIGSGDVVIELLDNVTLDYNARDEYGIEGTTSVTINGNNHTLTLNQKNSDWASIGLANNSKLVLNNMTIEKTGYGDTSGAWNTHAIIFSCPLEMTKVTVNNGIAVQAGATLNNVTINEANGYYGLWINGNGQSVTMNGGSITATNGGRGIKIADQYIDAPAQVTLNVTGTVFNTAKKAAVLVSSKAGAKIAASNVNIENVAEDTVNFVWVDEDWAANYGNVEVEGATVAQEGIENFVAAITKGANVEGYYKTLLAAVNAVQNGETITLIKDVTENVTLTEKTGLYYTIDGADKTMNGKIVITPLSDENDNRLITIKNINFVNTADAAVDFISSAVTNHYPRLTVEGCTFTGNGKNTDVALRLKTAYGAVIKDCTGKGLHSFLQNTAGKSLTIENVTVTESKSGFALGTVQGVTVKGCEIAVAGYGIRLDANTYNNNAVIENNKVTAFIPVVVRKVNTNSNITFQGANTMTATNTDGYWCVIGTSEYEANGELPTAATGNVFVSLNDEGLSYEGVYGHYAVAQIGDVKYASLQAAVNAVKDGDTITLIADEVFTKNNRYNNNGYWDGLGYSGDKSFTIDLAGKTIKQDGALNDYLIWIKNDGSKDNTINIINGTIDAGTTAYCALATASSNSNKITINTSDINFVGNNSNGAVLKIRGGAELNAKAGTIITGNNNYVGIEVVGTNTVVNINEGVEIYQNGTGSYVGSLAGVSSGATLNVIGGKGTSAQGGFIAMTSGGTINVSGGEWIANTNGTPSNDNKGVLIAQSEKGAKSIVNVKGGTFRGGYNCYGAAAGDAQINIKGGNFNANPTTYVVDKYEVVKEANGTFTVKMASFEKFYTATGVETTTGGVFSLAFEPTSETEVSVKIGSKNPAENKNYDLIIPSSVEFDGKTFAVTSIPVEGFKGCKGFDKLVVPGTITSVSASAFHNCSRLKEIIIEEGVQKLGKESFYKISDLETLTLPSTLTRIETLCFNGTHNIKTIVCNAQTPPTAFKGSFTELIYKNALVYVAGEYEDYKAATGWQNFNNIIAVGATQTIVKTNYTLIATITDIWNKTCSVEIGTAPTNTKRAQLEIPEHVSFSGIEFDITSIPESGFQDCKYFEGTLTIPAYITSIDSIAFNGCSGITELVVEEGVTSLGTYGTFEGCRDIETIILPSTLETIPSRCFHNIQQKLNTIVCYAMTPPTLGSNFSDGAINDGLTLYVHNVDAYKKAARWKKIKSIRLIGAVAQNMTTSREYKSLQEAINEAAGATVKVLDNVVLTEAITVAAGAEVTLDLNGKVVSYESAVVGEDMITNNGKLTVESSVAGGKITYNNTDETGSNVTISTISTVAGSELIINGGIIENTSLANYSSRVLVPYAIDILTNGNLGDVNVTINGGEIVSTKYIAIRQFVNGNVCNNSLTVKGGTITGLKRAINVQDAQGNGQVKNCAKLLVEAGNIIAGEGGYAICNFANSENVALTGGNFVGTVYSAIDGIISGGTFSEEPYSGYLADGFICEPNADGTYSVVEQTIFTQTIQLSAGWNWFSSYVETDLDSLQAALGTSGVKINSKDNGYTEYYEDYGWFGTLNSMSSTQMYKIETNENYTIELNGELLEDVEITLNSGWNWVSFPMNTNISVAGAFEDEEFEAQPGDRINSKGSGYSEYYEGYGWFGTLTTLQPGQGYKYYSNNDNQTSFVYSNSRRGEAKANITTDGNYWIPNASQYANNMTMTAVLDVENINYEVAAFVNGECRGSARPIYVEPLDAYMLFLTIHGEEVEEMTFKYYDIDTDTEYTLSDRINYSNNAILGSLKEPYMFTRGTTGIGEAELSQLNIYPNPTTTADEINLNATFDKVEVFNAIGVKVAEYSNVDSIDALETAGIYVIRATNNSVISHCRLVVK